MKAWDNGSVGCMYVQRIDGLNASHAVGKHSDELTGEAIVELSPLLLRNSRTLVRRRFMG